uniref:3-phosphoinositide-dependent protein kinase 1-like n=1 Tax=Styela clava TaxID=7725 RepID=UPI00193AD9C5|nr:3-phosphoinositide-dependent protein kinase 1-like [Styela clava]
MDKDLDKNLKTADDFMVSKLLGEDNDSTVVLARDVHTDIEYAIKIIEKSRIEKGNKKDEVEREKNIINQLNHPFFVKLHFMFEDEKRLYYVLSYASMGDLLSYIENSGRLSRPCVQHYTGELVLALEYLKGLNIIHRDIKPENILLTSEMHIQLTDFGTARLASDEEIECANNSSNRKTSFVGTADYVPPELLVDKCSNINSDLWSLGCVIFQMLTGKPPFCDATDFAIFQKVIKINFSYPDFVDEEAKDLINGLLKFDSNQRLGSDECGGFEKLKEHPFFRGVNWDELHTKIPPPISRPVSRLSVKTSRSSDSVSDKSDAVYSRISPRKSGTMKRQARPVKNSIAVNKLTASEPDDIEGYGLPPDLSSDDRDTCLEKQMGSTWHHFSNGALILKRAELEKKRGLSVKTRQFLLMEGPKLVYVDPSSMEVKGEIPWSRELKTEVKTFKSFHIHVPGRTYHLVDKKGNAIKWCRKIDDVKQFYYGSA